MLITFNSSIYKPAAGHLNRPRGTLFTKQEYLLIKVIDLFSSFGINDHMKNIATIIYVLLLLLLLLFIPVFEYCHCHGEVIANLTPC